MRKAWTRLAVVALLGLSGTTGFVTPSLAETGQVAVVFTKGGFILGVGGGEVEPTVLVLHPVTRQVQDEEIVGAAVLEERLGLREQIRIQVECHRFTFLSTTPSRLAAPWS